MSSAAVPASPCCVMVLYSLLLGAALVLAAPVWVWRMLRQHRYRAGLAERLGGVRPALAAAAQGRLVAWVHAVSVGETVAALPLIAALEAARPDLLVILSTTTDTGQRVARERLGADRVFYYPLDFAFAVRPWLRALRPALLLLMESELWPRMLAECERAGVPVAVSNARISDRSLPRYRALRRLWRPLLAKVRLLLAQSELDRDRWLAIGAPSHRTHAVGNLKYDLPPTIPSPLVAMLRRWLPAGMPVLVAGSTHPGEEALLLQCTQPPHLLMLAPRHPERTAAVEALVRDHDREPVRLSAWRLDPKPLAAGTVLLVDTVGELSTLYELATVAFVGGSLLQHGGHNPLEPARFGVPVLVGTHTENFRGIVAGLQAAGALRVISAATLCEALTEALASASVDPSQRNRITEMFARQSGATARTVGALLPLLPPTREVDA